MSKLLEVNSLTKVFKVSRGLFGSVYHTAVKDVSFSIERGEIFALVGESGSGKTTIGRIILRLEKPTQGNVKLKGIDIKSMGKEYTKRVGAVFQDPFSSLNPYMNVREIIEEPMIVHGLKDRDERIAKVMDMVKLSEELLQRKPNQLSGGQRQRVAIARAVSLSPDLLVADEPTASLDASVRREILNLFAELKQMGISTLLITHDIRAVERIADRVGIIYAGILMELGSKNEVLANPKHPYTKYLLENVPARHPRYRKIDVEGNEISEGQNLTGCPFYWLCSERMEGCKENIKEVLSDGRLVKCNLY